MKDMKFDDDMPAEERGEPFVNCKVGVENCSIVVVGCLKNEAVDAENEMATDDLTALHVMIMVEFQEYMWQYILFDAITRYVIDAITDAYGKVRND